MSCCSLRWRLKPQQLPLDPVMNLRIHTVPRASCGSSSRSFSGGSAIQSTQKPPPLRIIVPTNLALPTPPSLPTPVSSSRFTFSGTPELVSQSVIAPLALASIPPSCPRVTDVASPASSQFLLTPSTAYLENMDDETTICVSPLATPGAANESMHSGSHGTKSGNLRPWEVPLSTWLSDLGGHTETDRIFRHNLLEIPSLDTGGSPTSTAALSPSIVSPASQASSSLPYNSLTPVARSLTSLPPTRSPYSCVMSFQSPSPTHLVLKPTGTDTFPSTLDSLQAWRESVAPGPPQSEELYTPLSESIHGLGGLVAETHGYPSLPPHQPRPHLPPRVSRSQTFVEHAKIFGGRVKQFVARRSINKHRGSMDRGINFRVVTSQDSENGSVILITAPPPPYDPRPPTLICHSSTMQEHTRSRTISEYSSAVQASSVAEVVNTDMVELGSRQGNALRRLSFAALSTIKRL